MAKGYVFKKGRSWHLRYWHNVNKNGQIVRRQKCEWLAPYGDRYRTKRDLAELVAEKLSSVKEADKCPRSSDSFVDYVEEVYLPFVLRDKKASTYSGYKTHFERYIKPRAGKYALRDFTVAVVSSLLEDIAREHTLNKDTFGKIRSIPSGIFTYAIGKAHFSARSDSDNPARRALIPESAVEQGKPEAAKRDEVKALLAAFKDMPLERAAVGIMSMLGTSRAEARGLRWEDWGEWGTARGAFGALEGVIHSLDSTESIGYVGNSRQTSGFVGMVGSFLFNELFNAFLSSESRAVRYR